MIDNPPADSRPVGDLAISIILFISAAIAFITGVLMVLPGSFLDPIWTLNPHAYTEFAILGRNAGILLLILGGTCTALFWDC